MLRPILASLSFFLAAAAFAGDGCDPAAKDKENVWLAQELNLSAQQKDQVQKISEKYAAEIKRLQDGADRAKDVLVKDMQVPRNDVEYKKTLRDRFKEVNDLKRAYHLKKFEMALEIRELLTEEQIAKIKTIHRHSRKDR